MKKKIFLLLMLTILFSFTDVKAATKNIEISNVSVIDKSGTITVVDPVFSSNEITSNITFNQKDDFVTFELTLKNNENDKYKIESIEDNNTNSNLKIEYDYDTNYLSKGDTSKIKVKLTYKNQLVNVDRVSLNDLQIFINLVNEDGKSSEIIINPTTGDNVLHYLVLLIIALTGLVFVRNNKKKFGKALMILPIILLPFAVFAKDSYKINIKFTDIDVIGEFESYNITINPDNGEGIDTRTITYGQKIGSLPSNPTKEGYEFDKWVDNNGREVTSDTVVTGPITIKAKYNIIKYDITYNYDGGSATNPSKYTIEDEITLNNPTRNGYSFAGWTGTGISTAQSTVTIPVGSTGARSYVAHWSAGEDTPYRVIHKYQNLDLTTYTDVVRNLTGPTGETITVAFESKYGFDNPASTENVTVDPDELQVVTYYYNRTNYNFSISDRTYVDASSTADNSYPYETNIYVKALERPGYTFSWSDGDTNYERTFKLEDNKTIYPVYTANTNTPYKVKHYKMKLDGSTYEIAETDNKTGTTDAEITPSTKTYDGFTSPSTQTTFISGSGDTVVEYYYTRNQYTLTITNPEFVEVDKSGSYYYEEQVSLTAKTREGYTFTGWSTGESTNTITVTIPVNGITVEPLYTANTNTPYKVKHYKMKLDGTTYEIAETENKAGTTDAEITPSTKTYDGFTSPSTQTTFISGSGDTVVEYYYTRNQYTLTITNPEFVEVDKSGSYYYEEQVSLTAKTREGYTFTGWSTGESTNTITVTIPVNGITVEPLYTANNNTTYKVIHKYAKLTDGYDVEEVVGTGTTGDTIPAPIKSKTGFVNPTPKNITIAADGKASVTYEYQREEYSFTVIDRTYLDNTSTSNGTYPYETPITLKAKTREGYTFKWSDDVTDLERTFDLTEATTLSLVYTANTYNVHFDKNDELAEGSMLDQEFTYDTPENLDANQFVKTGYTFAGWNTSPDGTGLPYIDGGEVTNLATSGTVNLYAEWTPNTNTSYKVIHKKQTVTLDGYEEIVENLTGTSDSTVTPTVNDYTGFTKPAAQTVPISRLGDTVVTYVYDREIYTISFVTPAGSTTVADQEVAYGAKVTRPANPEKEGYTFDDWYKDSSYQTLYDFNEAVTESMPIYANYEINSYTVTFDTDGGSTETPQIVTYKGHATRPTTDPEKTGYDFINWYKDSNYETVFDFATEEITDETTIYAKFEIKKFTVTFNTDGGTNIPSQTVNYGSKVTRPADPEKTGYDFINWYKDSNYETLFDFDNTEIKSTTTIYAKFSQQSITVTFDTDGGSTVSPITVEQGESINELPTPTKENNKFLGWYENLSDANPVSEPYTPASSIELHAKWQKLVCKKATTLNTETCNSASGKGCRANRHEVGDTITYGNVINSDTFKAGDALDCDVDGTGYNQRFYYVTDNGGNAVLISHTTFSGDIGQSNINVYYNYATSLTLLPTTTQWSNLPVKFEIQSGDYRPARFIRLEELQDMTGNNYTQLKTDGVLNDYEFLFENSSYSGVGERSTVWLEQTTISGTDKRIRYRNDTRKLEEVTAANYDSSKNCIKPVIEVPYDLIDDSYIVKYNANGGTSEYSIQTVKRGDALLALPTATYSDNYFAGWYTNNTWTTRVDASYVPTGYDTYIAKWLMDVTDADLDSTSINLEIGSTSSLVINNISDIEPVSYSVLDDSIVSINSDGDINALDIGTTKIIITGLLSGNTKEVNVEVSDVITTYNVTFDTQGGTPVPPVQVVTKNTNIGTLPTGITKTDYDFVGWYTNLNYDTEVTTETIIDSDKTFHAKWIPSDAVAEIDGTYYTTLEAAFSSITTTNKTTIKVLRDFSSAKINLTDTSNNKGNRDIVLDLNNKTFTVTDGNAIDSKIKFLEVKNGTITSNIDQGVINVQPGSTLHVTNASLINTNSRQGIYNNGGTVLIQGNSYIENKKDRAAVQNLNNGTVTILSGTIYSKEHNGILNSSGTVTIGEKDGIYDTDKIVIKSGVSTTNNNNQIGIVGNVKLYDGMIMGKKAAINNENTILDTEENAVKVKDTELIDSVTYNRLYYAVTATTYRIDLDPNGGSVDPTYIMVNIDDPVGTLPTPTNGIYTFDGWYTEDDALVDSTRVPTGNETYTAKWSYTPSEDIVNYRTTNDAMKVYYNYIDSWKTSSSNFPSWSSSNKSPNWSLDATENAAMFNNFKDHNCQCADNQCSTSGTVMCDKPKGYSTGFNEKVNVYLSDENKTKGSLVTYAKSDNGTIYNLIPGEVYYWELDSDNTVHGYVRFTGERRILDGGDVRNMRDLGGLSVVDNNGNTIGTLNYGKLFRGIRLSSSSSVTELENLGINSQLDLREANSDTNKLSNYTRIETQNYYVNPYNYDINPNSTTLQEKNYYTMTRNAVKYAMEEVVNGNNLYFHCRIGTDRTGTVAYVLEGLLGVPEEERIEDYELSFFYGLVRVHRYHNEKPGSSVGTGKERFVYMHNFMPTNEDIYDWYMKGSTNTAEDIALINQFRQVMINSN